MNILLKIDLHTHGSPITPENQTRLVNDAERAIATELRKVDFHVVSGTSDEYDYTLQFDYHIGFSPEQSYTCSLIARDGTHLISDRGSTIYQGQLQQPTCIALLLKAYVSSDPTWLVLPLLSSDSLASTTSPHLLQEFMRKVSVKGSEQERVVNALLAVMPMATGPSDYRQILSDAVVDSLSDDLKAAIAWVGNQYDPRYPYSVRSRNAAYALAGMIDRLNDNCLKLIATRLHDREWVTRSEAVSSFIYTFGFPTESRKGGIWCLGEIGDPEVRDKLSAIAREDRDELVRTVAADALKKIDSRKS